MKLSRAAAALGKLLSSFIPEFIQRFQAVGHETGREYQRAADAKAAPVLALQVALAGALAARLGGLWTAVEANPGSAASIAIMVLMAVYGCLLISIFALMVLVYIPRNPGTGKALLIYFEDIAAIDFGEFERRAGDMSPDVIERQLIDQIHRVSRIVSVKMRRVRWAIWLSLPSILIWIVLIAWGSVLPAASYAL